MALDLPARGRRSPPVELCEQDLSLLVERVRIAEHLTRDQIT
ncbi:MAG TPA: hypothetical protein VFZ68_13615 [Acidimicrobiales bacterium]